MKSLSILFKLCQCKTHVMQAAAQALTEQCFRGRKRIDTSGAATIFAKEVGVHSLNGIRKLAAELNTFLCAPQFGLHASSRGLIRACAVFCSLRENIKLCLHSLQMGLQVDGRSCNSISTGADGFSGGQRSVTADLLGSTSCNCKEGEASTHSVANVKATVTVVLYPISCWRKPSMPSPLLHLSFAQSRKLVRSSVDLEQYF